MNQFLSRKAKPIANRRLEIRGTNSEIRNNLEGNLKKQSQFPGFGLETMSNRVFGLEKGDKFQKSTEKLEFLGEFDILC